MRTFLRVQAKTSMINSRRFALPFNYRNCGVPALLIFFTVLSVYLVGDGLRDALDPYMTER